MNIQKIARGVMKAAIWKTDEENGGGHEWQSEFAAA